MDDGFSTTVTRDGDTTLISVTGEIDIATCERLRDAIGNLTSDHNRRSSLICRVSSHPQTRHSLNVLVQARGTLTADGGSLFLRNPSVVAHRLITLSGLEDLLQTDADTHATETDSQSLG